MYSLLHWLTQYQILCVRSKIKIFQLSSHFDWIHSAETAKQDFRKEFQMQLWKYAAGLPEGPFTEQHWAKNLFQNIK